MLENVDISDQNYYTFTAIACTTKFRIGKRVGERSLNSGSTCTYQETKKLCPSLFPYINHTLICLSSSQSLPPSPIHCEPSLLLALSLPLLPQLSLQPLILSNGEQTLKTIGIHAISQTLL